MTSHTPVQTPAQGSSSIRRGLILSSISLALLWLVDALQPDSGAFDQVWPLGIDS